MKWKSIMLFWSEKERVFLEDKYLLPPSKWSLKKRIISISSLILLLAVIEHILYVASAIYSYYHKRIKCKLTSNPVEDFISIHLSCVFNYIRYNHVLGIVFEYFNIASTFCWSYVDVFIIMLSVGLTFRFDQIYERMVFFKGRVSCFFVIIMYYISWIICHLLTGNSRYCLV